jgi:hypothetical protein
MRRIPVRLSRRRSGCGCTGATAGALFGISADLLNRDAGTAFLENVSRELFPGKIAIVAEVPEDRIREVQGQMESVGGTVIRGG